MSKTVNVFVAAPVPLDDFVIEFESLLGVKLSLFTTDLTRYYEGHDQHVFIAVANSNELENDRDLLFQDYNFEITIIGDNPMDPSARKKAAHDYARLVFGKLRDINKYDLMLTDDVSVKLDTFHAILAPNT